MNMKKSISISLIPLFLVSLSACESRAEKEADEAAAYNEGVADEAMAEEAMVEESAPVEVEEDEIILE